MFKVNQFEEKMKHAADTGAVRIWRRVLEDCGELHNRFSQSDALSERGRIIYTPGRGVEVSNENNGKALYNRSLKTLWFYAAHIIWH